MVTMYSNLFSQASLQFFLESRLGKADEEVERLTDEQLNSQTDDAIVEYVTARVDVEPLQIYPDHMTHEALEGVGLACDYCNPRFSGLVGDQRVRLFDMKVYLPFSGDCALWGWRPSEWGPQFPTGYVKSEPAEQPGILEFSITLPEDLEEDRFTSEQHKQMESLRYYLERSRKDVEEFRKKIPGRIREALRNRRARLEKKAKVVAALNIPLRQNPNAPALEPIPLQRKVTPPLPAAKPSAPEYAISDANYEYILKVIRHEGATFESAPSTFAKHGEEDLRNILLAHLNGHLEGAAKAEAFRANGKTDILIEFENRAAFVAECKNWGGEKVLHEALDQLLGYLTWRDCKTALILFNMDRKDFAAIQNKMSDLLSKHPYFLRTANAGAPGEWRIVCRSAKDADRLVTVHVFLFDLTVQDANHAT